MAIFPGRNTTRIHYWYHYIYSEKELIPWIKKINKIKENMDTIFIYFNIHSVGKAIVNLIQFKESINNQPLPEIEKRVMEKAKKHLTNTVQLLMSHSIGMDRSFLLLTA